MNFRHTWGACYSTSLGSMIHELGHCFDLVHTESGVMARGFDDADRYFTLRRGLKENELKSKRTPKLSVVRLDKKLPSMSKEQPKFTKISNTSKVQWCQTGCIWLRSLCGFVFSPNCLLQGHHTSLTYPSMKPCGGSFV